jgi:hypothetical protein
MSDPGRPVARRRAALVGAVAALATLLMGAPALHAQGRGEPRYGRVPDAVAERAVAAWNGGAARTVRGRLDVDAGDTLAGPIAVLDGPLRLSGVVRGDVIAINADVRLDSTTWVQGSLLVVGGVVQGRTRGRVDGDFEVWRAALTFREAEGRLVVVRDEPLGRRFARWRARGTSDWSDVIVRSAHTYNRVEGLAILAGPRLQLNRGTSQVTAEALGIFRTDDRIAWKRENLGHRVLLEARRGDDARHVALGARHIDEVDAVERWALGDAETGLTSLLMARDYRDYWNRFGGHGYARAGLTRGVDVTVSLGRERWESRDARNPYAMFREGREWRRNPAALEGTATLLSLAGRVDTRNDPERPLDGWLVRAEYERGRVDVARGADTTRLDLTVGDLTYGRVFVDARRYNRVAPNTSVNLRLVAGGLLHGDVLPAQRRLSVSGVDALPGYGFRAPLGEPDVGTCNELADAEYTALGRPAGCDRILLLQAEWAGDFRIALFGRERRTDDRRWYADGLRFDGRWVVFVNSGRGWLVGPRDGGLRYPRGTMPLGDGVRTDAGVGLDFGLFGVYVAQPLNGPASAPRTFVRLGRRF